MNARAEAVLFPGCENLPRLGERKRAAVAKDVAVFGQTVFGNFRDQFLLEKLQIVTGAAGLVAIFRGNCMRAEECRDNLQRLFGIELFVKREDSQFAGQVKAVATFGLNRRRAMLGKTLEKKPCSRLEVLRGGCAEFADGVEDPATPARNFFIAN